MSSETPAVAESLEEIKDEAKALARNVKESTLFDKWTRLGYAVRGLLYGMIGFLAFQLLLTGRGMITDRNGALAAIAVQPFGKVFLIIIAVGAVGFALWGILRAILDPFQKGSDLPGILSRLGSVATGLSYGILVFPIVNMLFDIRSRRGAEGEQAEEVTSGLFTYSWGPWVVGLAGVAIFVIGLGHIYRGWNEQFEKHFERYRMTEDQRVWAMRMGKIGTISRGVVLAITGLLAILAALTLDPEKVGGIDQALAFLIQQPYGPWLLGFVALGLMAYAAYSLMGALWFKIKEL